jgi:hypothetical protein
MSGQGGFETRPTPFRISTARRRTGLTYKNKEFFGIPEKVPSSQVMKTTIKLQNCQGFYLKFTKKFGKFVWFTHKFDIISKIPVKRPLYKSFLSA